MTIYLVLLDTVIYTHLVKLVEWELFIMTTLQSHNNLDITQKPEYNFNAFEVY